jgi:hypothetical protein
MTGRVEDHGMPIEQVALECRVAKKSKRFALPAVLKHHEAFVTSHG